MRILTVGAIVGAFVGDVVIKMAARAMLADGGRFAFLTPVGRIGFVPSHNDVLAFSLPIPNGWIWPVGWVIVVALLIALVRSTKHEYRNSKQIRSTNIETGTMNETPTHRRARFEFRISQRQLVLLALVLGAISNLLDRTLRGGVTDYLSLTSLFPAFNLSDILIIGGVVGWYVSGNRRPHPL